MSRNGMNIQAAGSPSGGFKSMKQPPINNDLYNFKPQE